MSKVTSATYPVITVSKAGDQFLVVQNGQLKKLTRDGLSDFIDTLTADTILQLTDTPASYVGQQGKVLVVNPDEDGMVFEAATSGNWLSLSDTPGSYGGQANKLVSVNSGETALQFIDNAFTSLSDTPSSFTGDSQKIIRVNTGETALEAVTPTDAAPAGNLTGGWFDLENNAGSQSYTATGTFVKVVNDALGAGTRSDFAPPGVTTIYDGTVSQFDFTQLAIGDVVTVRVDMDVTTTTASQTISIDMEFAIGGTPFRLAFSRNQFKAAGTYQVTPERTFYIGETVQPNPAEVQFRSDANATLDNVGWFVKVERLGAL